MAYPSELIRRAQELRRIREATLRREQRTEQASGEHAPFRSRHGNYDKLMRSHDRLHPRHLEG